MANIKKSKVLNAGKYNKIIQIISETEVENDNGFPESTPTLVLKCKASVKTTRGMTIITANSDFEKAYTNFTIRYPKVTIITREMFILFNGKKYSIEYLNNINEANVELEIQAKEVTH